MNQVSATAIRRPAYKAEKIVIWLFLFLLIGEGALRKWFLPSLATPLLVVRDPLAVWLVFRGLQRGMLQGNTTMIVMFITTLISFILTMTMGHGNIWVAIYGARIYVIYFPLMYVIGKILTYDDVVKIGKVILWMSLGMTAILVLQHISSPSARINIGVGGEGTSTFNANGAGADVFRPSGTFSFISGPVDFYTVVAAYVLFFWLNPKEINRLLLMASSFSLIIAVAVSISRSLLILVGICVLFAAIIALLINTKLLMRMCVAAVVTVIICLLLLNKSTFFNNTVQAFSGRIAFAAAAENSGNANAGLMGSIYNRGILGALSSFENAFNEPVWGEGLGLGTNVGAQLTTGTVGFLVGEGEADRVMGEMGFILGGLILIIRLIISCDFLLRSYKALKRNNILPWMLASAVCLTIFIGQLGQPTNLGFMSLSGGLLLGAFNSNRSKTIAPKKLNAHV